MAQIEYTAPILAPRSAGGSGTAADFEGVDCILVDEAQFLSPELVVDLRRISVRPGVPVICYGLRTDFQTRLFPGAARLMELADSIEEVKVTCQFCNRKAIYNLRMIDGRGTLSGAQIELGANDRYAPVCCACRCLKCCT